MLDPDLRKPQCVITFLSSRGRRLREGGAEERGPGADVSLLVPRGEPPSRVFTDCLKQPEPFVAVAQEVLFDERLQRVQVGGGHLLGSLDRAAAAKYSES